MPLFAVLLAASIGLIADASFSMARGTVSVEYLLVCAGLTGVAALVVGGLTGLATARADLALAVWAGLHGLLLLGWIAGLGFTVVTAAVLHLDRTARIRPLGASLFVAFALCFTRILWPRLGLTWIVPPGMVRLADVLAFGAVLLAPIVQGRLRARWRWIPSPAASVVAAMALVFVAAPYLTHPSASFSLPEHHERDTSGSPPNVILLVLDTVRADHLSLYGYERDTTPALDVFVEQSDRAVVYPLAFAPSAWTVPSHASLFTGLIPSEHGAHKSEEVRGFYFLGKIRAEQTLAEVMQARGYMTAFIFANLTLARFEGMDRGFDLYYQPRGPRSLSLIGERLRRDFFPWLMSRAARGHPPAERINEAVLRFVDHCGPEPCFVVANYLDAHGPYQAARPHAGRFTGGRWRKPARGGAGEALRRGTAADLSGSELRHSEGRYDEGLRELDEQIGRLLGALEARGVLERSWLIITSDHGEAFGEHGTYVHGTGVHNEEVRIPLVIQPPRGVELPARSDAVDLIDVAATLSAIAGGDELGDGRDLRRSDGEPRPIQIELFEGLHQPQSRAVVLGDLKLIESQGRRQLYHLGSDPGERDDRSSRDAQRAQELSELLPPLLPSDVRTAEPLSQDDEESLRALGYIE